MAAILIGNAKDTLDGEQICSGCKEGLGREFAKLSPCRHYMCFRCLSRFLAEKSPTSALVCPNCDELITRHNECRRDEGQTVFVTVINRIEHYKAEVVVSKTTPVEDRPKPCKNEEESNDDDAASHRSSRSPRRAKGVAGSSRRSKMRAPRVLNEDELSEGSGPVEINDTPSQRQASDLSEIAAEDKSEKASGRSKRSSRRRETHSNHDGSPKVDKDKSHKKSRSREEEGDEDKGNRRASSGRSSRHGSRLSSSSRHGPSRKLTAPKVNEDTKQSLGKGAKSSSRRKASEAESGPNVSSSPSKSLKKHAGESGKRRGRRGFAKQSENSSEQLESFDENSSMSSNQSESQEVSFNYDMSGHDVLDSDLQETPENENVGVVSSDDLKKEVCLEPSFAGFGSELSADQGEENKDKKEGEVAAKSGKKLVSQMKAIARLAMLGHRLKSDQRSPLLKQKTKQKMSMKGLSLDSEEEGNSDSSLSNENN